MNLFVFYSLYFNVVTVKAKRISLEKGSGLEKEDIRRDETHPALKRGVWSWNSLSLSVMAAIGAAVGLDVLAIAVQIGFLFLQFFPILLELGFIGLNLGFAGVVGTISSQLLFVLLNDLFLLFDLLPVRLDVLFILLDVARL